MSDKDLHALSTEEQARLARVLRVAAVFVGLVLGVPLVNHLYPELANAPVLGFTASWLFLGVLIYPITVVLSFYFVAASNRIEADCVDWRQALSDEEGL